MHSLLKTPIESALSSPLAAAVCRRRLKGKRLILSYHGILPAGAAPAGERTLFVTQREFGRQLDYLARTVDVVPLANIDEAGQGRPRVAITFDDAYRGALQEGVRELAARHLPATFFVAPARLGGHTFWWDALAPADGALDEGVREHALQSLGGADERVRAWALDAKLHVSNLIPGYAQSGTLAQLRKAVEVPGITVGSHSWSHANLASLGGEDLVTELRRSRDWLRAEFGDKFVEWVAYPYGLDSEETRRAAVDASYVGGLRIGGSWHRPDPEASFMRPRLSVSANLSLAGFRARVVGALE